MRRAAASILLTVALQASTAGWSKPLLLRDVNVLPMDGDRVLEHHSVLIDEGVIVAMGPSGSLAVDEDAEVVDASGQYLLPGLSDMHAHIDGYASESGAVTGTSVGENQLLMYLATGITLLRDTAGSEGHATTRQKLQSNTWLGPELHYTTPVLEGENAVWDFSTKVLNADAVDELIAGYAESEYWGVKTYHTLSADVFEAVLASAAKHDLPVVGHVPFEVGIEDALRGGMLTIEHLRGYDFDGMSVETLVKDGGRSKERFSSITRMSDARMNTLVELTMVEGVWNCPTLAISRFLYDPQSRAALADHPRFPLVHPTLRSAVVNSSSLDDIFSAEAKAALREATPRSLELIRRLHEMGAGLLIGTDAVVPAWVPGFTPIDEMKMMASSGISNYEVLRMATVNAAEVLDLSSERGTISVGKRASLILLKENPLRDLDALWKLRGVAHNGLWLSYDDLKAGLEQQAESFPDAS